MATGYYGEGGAGGGSGPDLSDATPAPLGVASAGVSTEASRADHVHLAPAGISLSDVAAVAIGTAAAGVSGNAARYDHVHALPDGHVTLAKMANIATDRLIGRDTASTGVPEAITVGGGVEFSGSGGIQRSALTGDVTATAGSNATAIATDAVTTAKILNANVTMGKLADLAGLSIIGRSANTTGVPAAITGVTAEHVLKVNSAGTALEFGAVAAGTDIAGMTALTAPSLMTDYVPVYDTSATANRKVLLRDLLANLRYWTTLVYSDFQSSTQTGPDGFDAATVTFVAGQANHPGIVSLSVSASASSMNSKALDFILFGGSTKYRYAAIVKTPASLSDGTNRYEMRHGFGDINAGSGGGDSTDSVMFRYVDNVNAGKWQLVTRSNSTETITDTGITVAANTWYDLQIEVNADGTSAQAFINGSAAGSAATTNIPTGTGRETGIQNALVETVGSASRISYLDACAVFAEFTAGRV